jgi:hypothetical protein
MRMPGFTAEGSIAGPRSAKSRSASRRTVSGVYPAMTILVDGVYYCDGEITDSGVNCYGSRGGGGVGGGGVGGDGRLIALCRAACRRQCGGRINTQCYRDCVADC